MRSEARHRQLFQASEALDRAAALIIARAEQGQTITHEDLHAIGREAGLPETNDVAGLLHRLERRLQRAGIVLHNVRGEGWKVLPYEAVRDVRGQVRRMRVVSQVKRYARELEAVPPGAVSMDENRRIAEEQGRMAAIKAMTRQRSRPD